MCRLFGYVSQSPTSPLKELGEEEFEEFTALSRVHSDGWGMAWKDAETGLIRVRRSPQRADADPEYADLTARPLGAAGFVHLRWATGGLAVGEENTHPFLDDNMAFAHNGHLEPIDQLEAVLTAESKSRLRGTTDSERYFQLIRQSIQEVGNEKAGVTKALRVLMRLFPHASLNALLLTSTQLFAIHVNSRADSPHEQLREMFESPDVVPARHEDEYYAMDYQSTETCFHVISSGLAHEGWASAASDAAVAVNFKTRDRERLDFLPHSALALRT
ncbi:MAG: class II glutamine amidotransferase [Leucobacter sp.]